jgi:hypothetical protein
MYTDSKNGRPWNGPCRPVPLCDKGQVEVEGEENEKTKNRKKKKKL